MTTTTILFRKADLNSVKLLCVKKNGSTYVDITSDKVIVTEGISEGIQMVLAALVERGDEILFPGPTYPPYISYTKFFDGTPVPTDPSKRKAGFQTSMIYAAKSHRKPELS